MRPDQKGFVRDFLLLVDEAHYGQAWPDHCLCLLGKPGAGKTFITSSILEQCTARSVGVLSCAFTGSATTLLTCLTPSGQRYAAETVNTTLKIPYQKGDKEVSAAAATLPKALTEEEMTKMCDWEWTRTTLVILVDELSVLLEYHVFRLQQVCWQMSLRLFPEFKQALLSDPTRHPFGVYVVALIGDEGQKKPVQGRYFFEGCIKKYLLDIVSEGYAETANLKGVVATLVRDKFKFVRLAGQARSTCAAQTAIVEAVGNCKTGYPFTDNPNLLPAFYKQVLTPETLQDWLGATFIVTCNAERFLLSYHIGVAAAKARNVPFFVWCNKVTSPSNFYTAFNAATRFSMCMERKDLVSFFYEGAPGVLNAQGSNRELKTRLGIVNGAQVTMQAMVFANNIKTQRNVARRVSRLQGFQICFLGDERPVAIECTLTKADPARWPVAAVSSSPGRCNIMVSTLNNKDSVKNYKTIPLIEFNCPGVDSAHAVTSYKVQGWTLDRAVILLNFQPAGGRNIAMEDITVSASRVRDIARWAIFPLDLAALENLEHLRMLQFEDAPVVFTQALNDVTRMLDKNRITASFVSQLSKATKALMHLCVTMLAEMHAIESDKVETSRNHKIDRLKVDLMKEYAKFRQIPKIVRNDDIVPVLAGGGLAATVTTASGAASTDPKSTTSEKKSKSAGTGKPLVNPKKADYIREIKSFLTLKLLDPKFIPIGAQDITKAASGSNASKGKGKAKGENVQGGHGASASGRGIDSATTASTLAAAAAAGGGLASSFGFGGRGRGVSATQAASHGPRGRGSGSVMSGGRGVSGADSAVAAHKGSRAEVPSQRGSGRGPGGSTGSATVTGSLGLGGSSGGHACPDASMPPPPPVPRKWGVGICNEPAQLCYINAVLQSLFVVIGDEIINASDSLSHSEHEFIKPVGLLFKQMKQAIASTSRNVQPISIFTEKHLALRKWFGYDNRYEDAMERLVQGPAVTKETDVRLKGFPAHIFTMFNWSSVVDRTAFADGGQLYNVEGNIQALEDFTEDEQMFFHQADFTSPVDYTTNWTLELAIDTTGKYQNQVMPVGLTQLMDDYFAPSADRRTSWTVNNLPQGRTVGTKDSIHRRVPVGTAPEQLVINWKLFRNSNLDNNGLFRVVKQVPQSGLYVPVEFSFMNATYSLSAIVVHQGHTLIDGHYIAYVRSTVKRSLFLLINDRTVTPLLPPGTMPPCCYFDITKAEEMTQHKPPRAPYIAFYKKNAVPTWVQDLTETVDHQDSDSPVEEEPIQVTAAAATSSNSSSSTTTSTSALAKTSNSSNSTGTRTATTSSNLKLPQLIAIHSTNHQSRGVQSLAERTVMGLGAYAAGQAGSLREGTNINHFDDILRGIWKTEFQRRVNANSRWSRCLAQAIAGEGINPSDEVVVVDSIPILMSSFRRLRNSTSARESATGIWLDDEIVSGFCCVLFKEMFPRCQSMNSHFYDQAMNLSNAPLPATRSSDVPGCVRVPAVVPNRGLFEYRRVQRHTRRFKLFDDFNRFAFPINIGNTHWVWIGIDFDIKTIYYFDGYHGDNGKFLQFTILWLEFDYNDKKTTEDPPFDRGAWTLVQHPVYPNQTDGTSCGVYVILGMYSFFMGIPFHENMFGEADVSGYVRMLLAQFLLERSMPASFWPRPPSSLPPVPVITVGASTLDPSPSHVAAAVQGAIASTISAVAVVPGSVVMSSGSGPGFSATGLDVSSTQEGHDIGKLEDAGAAPDGINLVPVMDPAIQALMDDELAAHSLAEAEEEAAQLMVLPYTTYDDDSAQEDAEMDIVAPPPSHWQALDEWDAEAATTVNLNLKCDSELEHSHEDSDMGAGVASPGEDTSVTGIQVIQANAPGGPGWHASNAMSTIQPKPRRSVD